MKKFFELCAGLTFITTVYVFIAGILHAAFGIDVMLKVGHGTSWINLPQETYEIFIVGTMLLFVFLFFWGLAKFDTVTAWVKNHRIAAFFSGVLLIATIVGGSFFLQSLDDDNIFLAVQKERTAAIEKLLTTGIDINQVDNERLNSTPLHDAATWNSKEMIEFLIKKGANVNAVDSYNRTPLMAALLYRERSETENAAVFDLLIASGTDLSIRSTEGKTAYDLAIEKNYVQTANRVKITPSK